MKKTSPIKIKDYFTNPIHRISQPAFVEVSFNPQTLNTFVKTFTNRYNSRYISYQAIQQFIKSFTNNSTRLIQTYQQFFLKNFTITEDGNILLEHFIQFFTKETPQQLEHFDQKHLKALFQDLGQLNIENLMRHSEQLGIPMSEKEAHKMIKMLNFKGEVRQIKHIEIESFIKALQSSLQHQKQQQ